MGVLHCALLRKVHHSQEGQCRRYSSYHRVENVIVAPVREHSQKPEEIYGFVQKMCPDMRNLEIFAKSHNEREGWTSCGNELVEMRQ
ncbi:MT-A70 family protein [Oxytricha trifallax]|uniref:mRNA m(6)A methyltransferase n=1 Tax=Oxytricha trifallax TaxID=1172189 RepID=A0A073ICB7_9SPIT|nr:MT-A70 family protein [Oxytricha trifallax]